ncbi:hypothetical protein OIU85_018501 [Salix viminalis]|uniref:Uncharacterized protein n=1 Tax=Salix viminalis TaxID=40686 RepID=A0A9Q0ZJ27_SALVM|nr:hypothetical protein OIU85_018501 [Salix viminalis]
MNPRSIPNIPSWHPLVQKKLGRLIQVTEEKESEIFRLSFFLALRGLRSCWFCISKQASKLFLLSLFAPPLLGAVTLPKFCQNLDAAGLDLDV